MTRLSQSHDKTKKYNLEFIKIVFFCFSLYRPDFHITLFYVPKARPYFGLSRRKYNFETLSFKVGGTSQIKIKVRFTHFYFVFFSVCTIFATDF